MEFPIPKALSLFLESFPRMGVIERERSRSAQGQGWDSEDPENSCRFYLWTWFPCYHESIFVKTENRIFLNFFSFSLFYNFKHLYRWRREILLCPGLHKCYGRTLLTTNTIVRKGYLRSCNLWNTNVFLYALCQCWGGRSESDITCKLSYRKIKY